MHRRLLALVDELHRVGFEQVRFARSRATQHVRLQVYAACHVRELDWLVTPSSTAFLLSDASVILMRRDDRHLALKWEELLRGDLKPRHLAGQFILDFPEIMRPAYAADHDYRQWFRTLRPHVQAGKLPVTYDEDAMIHNLAPDFTRHVELRDLAGRVELLPAPPRNPHLPDPV
ncbi:hypothetical protein L1280_000344 [Deinococcus sp. HSC-46F16]|uniref:hypothetical protein n=1 Tax=Deinococcus sp. HSC-46F16 TaxID=2910968 RepID=UPI00209D482C|nr:hypothetical protein [Deinococcus sp. HSC-46F16]MCP2013216.1 hypothetical protein [Deinococcus sp. HSC-46F16]